MDVTSVPRRELRSRMGIVLQDTWLFGGTIRDASAERVFEARTHGGVRRGPGNPALLLD